MTVSIGFRTACVAFLVLLAGCVVVDGPVPAPEPRFCPRVYDPVCAGRGGERITFPNACEARRDGYFDFRPGECRRGGDRPGPQRPGVCTNDYRPVCAERGRDRRTFGNSCEAERAGYDVVRDRACRGDEAGPGRPDRPERPRPDGDDRPRPGDDRPRPGDDRPRPGDDRPRPGDDRPGADRPRPDGQRPGGQRPDGQRPPRGDAVVCTQEYVPVCARVGRETRTFPNACMAGAQDAVIVRAGPC